MSSHAELVEELGRRFRAGDWDAAFELFHSGFRIQQPETLPHGGWHDGPSGMQAMSESFNRFWSRTISDPIVRGCDDTVLQVTTQTWTARDTGRSATIDVVELFSFEDGLIKEIRVFQQDTHLLIATLGDGSA